MRLIIWFLSLFRRKNNLLLPANDIDEKVIDLFDEHEREKREKETRRKKKEEVSKGPQLQLALGYFVSKIDTGENSIHLDLHRLNGFSWISGPRPYPFTCFSAFLEVVAEFCTAKGIKFFRNADCISVSASSFRAYIKRCKKASGNMAKCISQGAYR
jgi:hypothetical protein